MPIASPRCHRYVDRLPALLGVDFPKVLRRNSYRLAPLAKRSTCSKSMLGASLHFMLIGVINVKTGRATLIIDITLPVLEFGYF